MPLGLDNGRNYNNCTVSQEIIPLGGGGGPIVSVALQFCFINTYARKVMFSSLLVCLIAGLYKNY